MDNMVKKKLWVGILAFIGFLTTVKLAFIYYDANFNPYALSSFCSINEFIDCDGVAQTRESQFFGIPLALWGLILYSFIFLMLGADKLKNIKLFKFMEVFKNPLDYIASLGFVSFIISVTLLCVSLFEIKKLCILCALTYILNLLIALIATDRKNGWFSKSIKQSVTDFVDALKIKPYLIAFCCVVIAGIGILTYTTKTMVLAPHVKRINEFAQFNKMPSKLKVKGNILGNSDPILVVDTYTDYECPICAVYHVMIHKLADELRFIKVEHHNLPLDTACNKYLTRPFHQNSCMLARYSIAAKKQGNEWGYATEVFAKKPKTEDEILTIAKKLKFDIEQLKEDANSDETSTELSQEIEQAHELEINGTPATRIGKDLEIGVKPYGEFKAWVVKKQDEQRK